MDNNLFSYMEWEFLNEQLDIVMVKKSESLPDGPQKIVIWRDESYKLQGKIIGETNGIDLLLGNRTKAKAGQIDYGIKIEGIDKQGRYYKLYNCNIKNKKMSPSTSSFEIQIKPRKIIRTIKKSEKKENMLIEYYINGLRDTCIFNKASETIIEKKAIKKRLGLKDISIEGGPATSISRNFMFIELNEYSFLVQIVPEYLGPKYSHNISIEYHMEWGKIPEENERKAISEIISFILGKQLLNVGYATFDESNCVIDEICIDPWGNNIISKCKNAAKQPISNTYYFEKILQQLIPKYLELREPLNLKQALWNYWIALDSPIGVDLPILSSGIETIAKSWFKTSKSKTKGVYIPKKEYESLLGAEFGNIEKKLNENVYKERIINRIKNSYNMGANERLKFFFLEIGLPTGENEIKLIKERNAMVHGDSINSETIIKAINVSQSFQTLFNRIILKILGYDDVYTDYSLLGYPDKNINEPLGN